MYPKAKITQAVIASTMLVLTLGGCVKQRPEIQSQGDRYQVPVSIPGPATNQALVFNADSNSFTENTAYTIKTAPVALIPAQNSVAEEIFTESESGIKFLDIANFESDHPLLAGKANDAYMLGEPNKTYGVAQELTPKHLIIYKVVDEQDLAFSEKTIATAKDGKWLVPVGGYPVTYFRRARVVNEDNRETNLTADFPIPGEEFRTATSYRVNKADFLRFERLQKEDTLPKDFFNGEWYFSETTVDTSYASGGVVGDLGAADSNFPLPQKSAFAFTTINLLVKTPTLMKSLRTTLSPSTTPLFSKLILSTKITDGSVQVLMPLKKCRLRHRTKTLKSTSNSIITRPPLQQSAGQMPSTHCLVASITLETFAISLTEKITSRSVFVIPKHKVSSASQCARSPSLRWRLVRPSKTTTAFLEPLRQ